MMMSGRFEQGKADGEWVGQYRGSARRFRAASQDHPDGKWSVFFQNGARAVLGQYENGKDEASGFGFIRPESSKAKGNI